MSEFQFMTVETADGGLALRRKRSAELMADAGSPVYGEASGFAAAFSDAAGGRLFRSVAVRFYIEQSGSGAVSENNIRPLVGRTSVTVRRFAEDLFSGTGYETGKSLNSDGTVSDETGMMAAFNAVSDYIPVSGMTSVVVRYVGMQASTAQIVRVVGYNAAKTATGQLFEVTSTVKGESMSTVALNGAAYIRVYRKAMFFHSFGVYAAGDQEAVTVAFPDDPGTVYGGTADIAKGVLTLNRAYKQFIGAADEPWNIANPASGQTGYRYFFCKLGEQGSGVNGSGVCSHLPAVTIAQASEDIGQYVVNSSARHICMVSVRPSGYASMSNIALFKTWLAEQAQNGTPVELSWELTEPVTYAMAKAGVSSLDGENSVVSDGETVTVEYARKTEAAFGDLADGIAAVSGMIAEDMPGGEATRNIAEGEFLTYGGKLYRATMNIADGESFTSSNVEETTVGEQLAAIWAALNA